MPLEIRELQIKVTVDQPQDQGGQQNAPAGQPQDDANKESVINQCIDQVMDILNKRKER